MAKRRIDQRLADILEAISNIQEVTQGITFDHYYHDWKTRRIVERCLEIISEASRHVPDDIKSRDTSTNWRHVADIGNVLRHEYHNITDRIIYDITQDFLPGLEIFIKAQYERLKEQS